LRSACPETFRTSVTAAIRITALSGRDKATHHTLNNAEVFFGDFADRSVKGGALGVIGRLSLADGDHQVGRGHTERDGDVFEGLAPDVIFAVADDEVGV
jgi:hypothetical protein